MICIDDADTFFAVHLEHSFWNALESPRKIACISMAETDVMARLDLDSTNPDNPHILGAVCEQAVFIAANYDKLRRSGEIVSESIDGLGSRTYRLSSSENFSRRALTHIRRLTSQRRLSRG